MSPIDNTVLYGNVDGFHGSVVKESATLDLGALAWAYKPSGTGCGPNLEETTHPFGDPARFDIPIQSTGTYEHNDFTLRWTSKEDAAGGTLVIRIDGTLRG